MTFGVNRFGRRPRGAFAAVVLALALIVEVLGSNPAAHAATEPVDITGASPPATRVEQNLYRYWRVEKNNAVVVVGPGAYTYGQPDRSSCNPHSFEICDVPHNFNIGTPLPNSMRYIRRMVGLVYAGNASNGPHNGQVTRPDGTTGDNQAWLMDQANCDGYGLVYPASLALPGDQGPDGADYVRSDWDTQHWPRYTVRGAFQAARYEGPQFSALNAQGDRFERDDVRLYSWVSPYQPANRWALLGVYGWWYGCWKYATVRQSVLDLEPKIGIADGGPSGDRVEANVFRISEYKDPLDPTPEAGAWVRVRGWALDPNVVGSVTVVVKVNGVVRGSGVASNTVPFDPNDIVKPLPVATPTGKYTITQNAGYTDPVRLLNRAKGFDFKVRVAPAAGDQIVCVTVVNVVPSTNLRVLAPYGRTNASVCRPITVGFPSVSSTTSTTTTTSPSTTTTTAVPSLSPA